MLILAIDSATPTAGVALAENGQILYESFVNYKKTHSETFLPMIDEALRICEKDLADCSAIAVTIGPGSFTGLRIGLATAKALSLSGQVPVVGISTLQLLAHNLTQLAPLCVASLLDARKNEVYCAFYTCSPHQKTPQPLSQEMACSPESFIEQAKMYVAQTGCKQLILLGDGVAPYINDFKSALGEQMIVAPSHQLLPRAGALADLAQFRLLENPRDYLDIRTAKPVYLRLSEAENRLGKEA